MTAQAKTKDQPDELPSAMALARAAWRKSGGKVRAFSRLLHDWAVDDPLTRQTLIDFAIDTAARLMQVRMREDAWEPAVLSQGESPDPHVGAVVALARRRAVELYDMPLPPRGKPLGDCTAEDIAEALAEYRRQAAGMIKNIHWLSAIAALMKPDQRVRDCVAEAKLKQLQAAALKKAVRHA